MKKQIPPIRVSDEDWKDLEGRAKAAGMNVTEYVRYRVFGKGILTVNQLEVMRQTEKKIVDW